MADYSQDTKNQAATSSSLSNYDSEGYKQYKQLPGDREVQIEHKPASFNKVTPSNSSLLRTNSIVGERQLS